MTKEGCAMCNYPHGFYRTDDLGGQWKIGNKSIEITHSYQEYGGGPFREEFRKLEVNYCPWCGRKLEVAE